MSAPEPGTLARAAIFLDRDGTLMEDRHYCANPDDVRLIPGAREALAELKAAGYLLVVVTNQSGIGRGMYTEADYRAVEAEFERQLGPGLIDATYYCPTRPDLPDPRRKPNPGMVRDAVSDLGIDPARSWFVGDKTIDVECGRNAGTGAVLVLTGYGAEHAARCSPDFTAPDIRSAARWILDSARRPSAL